MGFNIAGLIDDAISSAAETFDDIDDFLDFGFSDPLDDFSTSDQLSTRATSITSPEAQAIREAQQAEAENARVNPHVDLTEVERANPTNLNFPNVANLPTSVLIIGGLLGGFVVLKALKVL